MLGPSATELLEAWEDGLGRSASERALALLAAGDTDSAADERARLPLGERDARLLALRRWAFGSRLDGVAVCPSCEAALELSVDATELAPTSPPACENGSSKQLTVVVGGHEVAFRLPNSLDVQEASMAGSVPQARRVLLQRCVIAATRDGSAVAALALPEVVVEAIEDAMAEHDPQADVRLALSCPECEHQWAATLDVGEFVTSEVDWWAQRLLVDVATLASAFGWTEAQVLGLNPVRRQAYLQLAG